MRTLCIENNAEIAFLASHKQESYPWVSRVKSYKLSSANQRENKDDRQIGPKFPSVVMETRTRFSFSIDRLSESFDCSQIELFRKSCPCKKSHLEHGKRSNSTLSDDNNELLIIFILRLRYHSSFWNIFFGIKKMVLRAKRSL